MELCVEDTGFGLIRYGALATRVTFLLFGVNGFHGRAIIDTLTQT